MSSFGVGDRVVVVANKDDVVLEVRQYIGFEYTIIEAGDSVYRLDLPNGDSYWLWSEKNLQLAPEGTEVKLSSSDLLGLLKEGS